MLLSQRKVFKIALVVFSLVLLEVLGWMYLKASKSLSSKNFKAQLKEKLHTTYYKDLQNQEDFFSLESHPYFGFVQKTSPDQGINNYGFSDPQPFPFKKKQGQYVLGVFGDELALDLGAYWQKHPEELRPLMNNNQGDLAVANFALPGSKEPQGYYVFSSVVEELDMAVFIEGHNELFFEDALPAPLEYPWNYSWLFTVDHNKNEAQDFYLKLIRLTHWQGVMAKFAYDWDIFLNSSLFIISWKTVFGFLENTRKELELRAGPKWPPGYSGSQITYDKLAIWKKFMELTQDLAELHGVKVYTFLAPNIYIPGTKPLSELERTTFINPEDQKRKDADYAILLETLNHWRQNNGPIVQELVYLFEGVTDDVYADDVSSLNDRGIKLLGQGIVQVLASAGPTNLSSPTELSGKKKVR